MIHYVEPLYRPPSEAESLIFQATLGCSHNRCAFCVAYQDKPFRVRPEAEVFAEIDWAAKACPGTRRVFLADGDALALPAERMLRLLGRLRGAFPALERVSSYASPQNLLSRSAEQLSEIRAAGLSLLYLGLESGDDLVLERIGKGAVCAEIVEGCGRATVAGFDLSVTAVIGLAGPRGSAAHAERTAAALSAIQPKYASALTLMLEPRSPSYEEVYGEPGWRTLTDREALAECRQLVAGIEAGAAGREIIFRANHASNYLALKGVLPVDRERLLNTIDAALANPEGAPIRPEWARGL